MKRGLILLIHASALGPHQRPIAEMCSDKSSELNRQTRTIGDLNL